MLTVELLEGGLELLLPLGVELVVLLPLLHPAAATIAIPAPSATAHRTPGVCFRIPTYPHLLVVKARNTPYHLCEAMLTLPSPGGWQAKAREAKYVTLSTTGVPNFALDARCRLTPAQGFVGVRGRIEMILCSRTHPTTAGLCRLNKQCHRGRTGPGRRGGRARGRQGAKPKPALLRDFADFI
ncbi:MAG TPA: hypothetical protein VMI33_21665 [Streptosporangiaceae bacterium]|nr:hypothetical protein [Streptosporangiaceae bacterium]